MRAYQSDERPQLRFHAVQRAQHVALEVAAARRHADVHLQASARITEPARMDAGALMTANLAGPHLLTRQL